MKNFQRPLMAPLSTLTVQSAKFNLNVLICQPKSGDHHHWAVQLDNLSTGDGTIFEVQGCHSSWESVSFQCRQPYYPLRIINIFFIREIDLSMASFGALAHGIEHQVPVKDNNADWNSQDYALGILDMLEEDWWIDDFDGEYIATRRKLEALKGPIKTVEKAVTARQHSLAVHAATERKFLEVKTAPSGKKRKRSDDSI